MSENVKFLRSKGYPLKDQRAYHNVAAQRERKEEDLKDRRKYWTETSDGWFTFYKNVDTGEKKKNLEEGDIEVKETINGYIPVNDIHQPCL